MRLTFFNENRENDKLYKGEKTPLWSVKITKRRLTFFGYACHLPETTPVKIALREALQDHPKNQEEDQKQHIYK